MNHPEQKTVATWHGQMSKQIDPLTDELHLVRIGFDLAHSAFPTHIDFTLDKDHKVSGHIQIESFSLTNPDKTIRFIVPEWVGNVLRFYWIEIDRDDNITVTVRENPPDPHRAGPTSPTPPTP